MMTISNRSHRIRPLQDFLEIISSTPVVEHLGRKHRLVCGAKQKYFAQRLNPGFTVILSILNQFEREWEIPAEEIRGLLNRVITECLFICPIKFEVPGQSKTILKHRSLI